MSAFVDLRWRQQPPSCRAADQARFTGTCVRGNAGRQVVVVMVHVVTALRSSWRIMRAPATETRAPTPVQDPDWSPPQTDMGATR